ncbi:MAG TPA: hypothetical protein VI603_09455 [Saprospiraceae bacterium]|nr:hypothetical protein [Saprospiraceae bacterium]
MRKNFLLTLSAIVLSSGMFAQILLKNDGAMLVIEPGATLVVEGGIENINGGTIDNDGTLEVQGDFLNSAIFDGTDPNTVIFSGGASANVTSGGDAFYDVEIDKASGFDISLLDDMTVTGDLSFVADNNKINVGANDLIIQDNGAIVGADDDDYVVTGDVGYLRKQGLDASETFVFPVGFDDLTYNPATLAANGGHTGDEFSVRVRENLFLDGLAETDQATEAAADAMWDITEGTVGGSDVNVTLQWAETDELADFPTEVGVSRHDGTNWDLLESQVSAPAGADPYTQVRNNVMSFSAFAVGGEPVGHALAMSLKTFLQGGYVSGLHRDSLRFNSLIPTDEPYTGLPYTHTGFGGGESVAASVFTPTGDDAITDWVVVELREAGNPTTILASKSALIQRDGDIVDLDGVSPLAIYGLADGSYHIALKHRNHLSIRTASAQALTNTPLGYDFTTGLSQAYDNPDPLIENDAMVLLSGGAYGMWGGDANLNNITRYNGSLNDKNAVLAEVGTTAPNNVLIDEYSIFDLNMDGIVRYNGASNDKNLVLTVVGTTEPNNVITGHNN